MDSEIWRERIRLWRYSLGRTMVHAGLKVMPPGRGRTELTALFWTWNTKVTATMAAQRAAEMGIGPDNV